MLEKKIVVGLISIMEDKRLEIREDTVVTETTGIEVVEISRTYNRYVSNPGDDISGKPQIVQDVANLLWTAEVVDAWKTK